MSRVFFGPHNIISSLGFSSQENFDAVRNGQSGLSVLETSQGKFCCSRLDRKKLEDEFSRLGAKGKFTALEKMCLLSIADTLQQSAIDPSSEKVLIILSTTKGNIDVLENETPFEKERAYLPSLIESIGRFFNAANKPLLVSNACISGLLAIIMAQRFIAQGRYHTVLVCGGDLVTNFTLAGFRSFNALSDEACKPFDAHRKGINLGEAAATVVLSKERLSNLYFESGASANDATHISAPSREGEGLYSAIRETIANRQTKTPLGFINAHGTATEYNDDMESVAFHRAGVDALPVNSLKGYFGHTLGAAGVLESIMTLMCLEKNILLESKGCQTPGTKQNLNVIARTMSADFESCMKTASGFGGCNAAAIFSKENG